MPSRWEIVLPGVDAATVKLEHLHAVVSSWFDDSDDAHRATAKPYTVSPPIADTTGTAVHIGLLTDDLAGRLQAAAAAGTRVRLGSAWSRLERQPQPLARVAWPELGVSGRQRAWCLRFVTPTTFRRGNSFTPAPSVRAIVGSLRRSWRDFAPAGLPPVEVDLAADPLWLTDIDVASQVTQVGGRTVSGFTGRLRFTCDADDAVAGSVDRLVRLAPFAGVGAYTTRGFGMVQHELTWAAKTAPTKRLRMPHPAPG